MLVVQSNGGPLTPASLSPNEHHLPTDLSPRSARSTSSSLISESPPSSSPTPTKSFHSIHHQQQTIQHSGGETEDFSALQRLQFALERDSLLSSLFHNGSNRNTSSPNLDLHLINRERHETDDEERESPRPIVQDMNTSLEDSGPRSTDSSSNLIETPTGSPNTNPTNIYQCPLCSIVCNGRHSFNEHLVTHTQQTACPKCDYVASTGENIRDHLQECHDLTDLDGLTDDEVRVPKINSQGKMKTFKCKQCQHISITKIDFWTHSKSHIRLEKMLTCPKCPFVTEYKHHLEYHLRNHVGSKPFQCTECPYSCVNKSMLNSHLKSHSSVYQYRCKDCAYVTKYCHSLKLHLRKYSHKPSAVLNPDGSQNPLTIIDVYGTRRGPKIKRPPPGSGSEQSAQVRSQGSPTSSADCDEESKMSDYNHNEKILPTSALIKKDVNQKMSTKRFTSDTSDSVSENEAKRQPLEKINLIGDINRNIPPFQHPIHISDPKVFLEQMAVKNPLDYYAACLNQLILANPILQMQQIPDLKKLATSEQHIQDQLVSLAMVTAQSRKVNEGVLPIQNSTGNQGPLDLRQPPNPIRTSIGHGHFHQEHEGQYGKPNESKKRNRKGKAQRYDRQIQDNSLEHNDGKALDFSKSNPELHVEREVNLICKYCKISFLDQVLYSMHMSYHSGDNDPFLCKSCGKKTPNKIAFSKHLTTDPH